jgi:DNA-directed RNA polymerase II subunit RPB2
MGALFNQEDMPFTKDGITPDIIVNAHAIPSRMTVAQIIECVGSKAGIMNGDFKDATPFEKFDVNTLCNELHKSGFQRHGYEVLYNGYTGLKMPCQIFIGPTYYQRLKHLVNDKIHSRNYGPLQGLIRQPTEGRSREGGLRLVTSLSEILTYFVNILLVNSIVGNIFKLLGKPEIIII